MRKAGCPARRGRSREVTRPSPGAGGIPAIGFIPCAAEKSEIPRDSQGLVSQERWKHGVCLCCPSWSVLAPSWFTATSTSQAQVILVPQPQGLECSGMISPH
ncbi:ZNF337-AS1 isoform 7 [Pongo abelii]|uniref:ZNF337-AS1 isoform 7 n=1 Tax=Pongo abelii TaxID=9601 RepID=A0A2J8S321_PONAB|nr:ZNF337-AS1 isoform 7 [Pongo abelii]